MSVGLQPTFLRFESIDSTNLEAMRRAKAGAAEGLCIVARQQTRGRGRLDRGWVSPKDAGVYVSIVLRPRIPIEQWPLIALMSALATADALYQAAGLRVDIKWPNDIIIADRKLAGILVETTESNNGVCAIVGVGINLKSGKLPPELVEYATSAEDVSDTALDADAVLQRLISCLAERYESLQSANGAEHTVREWCANSSYAFERRVRVSAINDTFEGLTRGLESDGALRVETADGRIRIVRAGDITALRSIRTK